MRKDKLVKIALSGLAFSFVVVSLVLLPTCEGEGDPTWANMDRQLRPLLEEALGVKLWESGHYTAWDSGPNRVTGVGADYHVEGRIPDPSQTVNSLVRVVQSLGVQEFEAGSVGNTSIVIFEELSILEGRWSGFIEAHPQVVRWDLHR